MERLDGDTVVKDAFEVDRATLLTALTGGVAVQEFFNVEIPAVLKRLAGSLN